MIGRLSSIRYLAVGLKTPGGTNSLISHLDSTTGTQPVTGILAARRFSPPSQLTKQHVFIAVSNEQLIAGGDRSRNNNTATGH
uniref:Uncharacterized protein n=1 Tax=Oryza sativa subsp. japonica TaxID=39947 RepID=Q67U42_ORYSJ|nr:hypothetical protein [Oryza sativa Japonica Group]